MNCVRCKGLHGSYVRRSKVISSTILYGKKDQPESRWFTAAALVDVGVDGYCAVCRAWVKERAA